MREKNIFSHSASNAYNAFLKIVFVYSLSILIRWHDNRFEVNWPPEPTLVLRWISKFFLFGALPSDTLKIKHTKKLKEFPSRHFLENLPEKASMYAFIHLKLIGNLQGFFQYIMTHMLNLTIADYGRYSAVVFLSP